MESGMRYQDNKKMSNPVMDTFRELWNLTGEDKMTRAQIADYFGKSAYWVQWMYVRSGVSPRTKSPAVVAREKGAEDTRLDYINEMQRKSALVAITTKLNERAKTLNYYPAHRRDFIRKMSDLLRVIQTTERRLERVKQDDPKWKRLGKTERSIENAKKVYDAAVEAIKGRKK